MKYFQPFDQPTTPNAAYVNGDPSNGVQGSIPDARGFEATQREIVKVLVAAGLTPSADDNTQLAQAIRGGLLDYYVDTGAVNALVINPGVVFLGLAAGNKFRVKAAFAPTGAGTLQVNANAACPIVKSGGAALSGGEWAAGDIVTLTFDGASFQYAGGGGGGSGGLVIAANTTFNVPSQYPTIRAALIAASKFIIASNVILTILVTPTSGAYTETLDLTTGSIDVNHPFGNRIQIVGPALNGSFPAKSDIVGLSKSQVLSLLQTRFRCIINAVGVDGIQIHSGGLNLLQNVLVVCDSTPGNFAIKVGDWQGQLGTGMLGVQNVWVHGAGQNGFDAQFLAAVRATNLGSTYCTYDGIRSAHGCNIEVNFGNVLSMYNSGNGVYCANSGQFSVDSSSGTVDLSYNTKSGINCAADGKFNALPATGARIDHNGQWGAYAFGQGLINLPGSTAFGSNSSGDLFAGLNSNVTAAGATVGTCSPAKNTNGNQNSYIVV